VAGGKAAIEEFLDNPYVNVGVAAIEGWKSWPRTKSMPLKLTRFSDAMGVGSFNLHRAGQTFAGKDRWIG
jgi:hypothetical protein